MSLNKDQILTATDLASKTVPVPEWGGEVIVQGMTAQQRDKMLTMLDATGAVVPDSEMKAFICAQCIVGDDGQRLFTDEDIKSLQLKNPKVLDRIAQEALNVSGMSAGAVDDAVKN